ncbi:MAG: nucleotidyltransferase family protein [Cyanobacteria bacterium RU_5_0]|nr:nucleotidyltransferase family protein [Cyanobacteria bacterium RU_5_0]
MSRDEVLRQLSAHLPQLTQLGVQSLALFGSVARNEAHPGSDVDILVELQLPLTFDRYMDVKFYLEDHLGVSVDLITRQSLRSELRSLVEQEAIYVS